MEKVRLGDICVLHYGKSLTANKRINGNVPVYSSAGLIGYHNVPLVNNRGIIIGRKGTVGKVYKTDKPFYCIDTAFYILPDDDIYDFDYLYYCLKSLGLENLNEDSAVPGLNRETAYSQLIYFPKIEIQKKIAKILLDIDLKIENNAKINDNLEKQVEAIYQSLFVYFNDIPENQFKISELGPIPIGWKVKHLSEVTTSIRTKVKHNNYKVLSAINTGQLQLSEEYFTKQVFSKNLSNYIAVEPFDFAYNPARINIGSIGMNTFGFTGCVSPVYVVVRAEPEYYYFLNFFIKSKRFSDEVKVRSSGSVRQSLSYTDFGQIKIVYPPINVIDKFNHEYKARQKTIEHIKEENKKLASLRNTLLSKLMCNKLDVSSIDI